MTGYLHPDYAQSLAEFGLPIELPKSRGWLLQRPIPNSESFDAMGCYPIFCCQDWTRLHEDLDLLRERIVSVSLVTDPFGNYDETLLRSCFDRVIPFKEHFIVDLSIPIEKLVSKHHRRYARKALEHAQVEVVDNPASYLDEWTQLYSGLVRRHNLSGIKAFSRDSFIRQLSIPGLVMMRIVSGSTNQGTLLWFIQNGVAYAHLMALTEEGYAANAFYGLFWRSIEIFKESFGSRVSFLHLGGTSGLSAGEAEGMLFFKKGWSSGIRTVWFCASVLQPEKYSALCAQAGVSDTGYFPAYRLGQF